MRTGVRLLLLDDDADDRRRTLRELRREFPDLQATQITGGAEFARALDGPPADLVLTDHRLGWTDGLAILKAVKARWPEVPVLFVTGPGNEAVAVEAMKAGLNDYVLKAPLNWQRLPGAVGAALERQAQRRTEVVAETGYRTLFDGSPTGLYRASPAGRLLEANPALVQMLGYPDCEALLAVDGGTLYVNPQDRLRWWAQMERDGVVRGFEKQLRRRDGTTVWVRNTARLVRDAAGQVLYIEGALEDITQRKRAEQALAARSRQLEALREVTGGLPRSWISPPCCAS